MPFRELFIVTVRRKGEKGEAVAAAASKGEPVGIFITPKSLTTFPTASFVVTLLGILAKTLFPTWATSHWVPIVISLFVGSIILVATTLEPSLRPRSWQGWFLAIAVGLINSLYLAAAALGLLNEIGRK